MAITDTSHENPTRFFGLSSDTKPISAMIGATFYETDTPDSFVFNGSSWVSFRLNIVISGSEAQVNVIAKLATDAIQDGTTALTPKFAIIDAATSGNNTLIAAVAGKKIRVIAAFLVGQGDVDVRFEDGADGTALTGQMDVTANSGFTLPFNPVGWFETTANTLLNLELSAAVSVDGCLVYVEV